MGNIVPPSARQILERTLDNVRVKANSNGECFGGEITDAMREAGAALGADRLEVLLTRTVLVRTMESLGENYPAEVLQDYDNRMRVSDALKYLSEAIDSTTRLQRLPEGLPGDKNISPLSATTENLTT
ncbi:MAG TPA: hypothetical protein VFE61_19410 [Candidatus Sulfotelmatobacter sp.]|nr:hypothetical protein [Candidatus Sulfotelmatobacter sp.]